MADPPERNYELIYGREGLPSERFLLQILFHPLRGGTFGVPNPNINQADMYGLTALIAAATVGDVEVVSLLIEAGADVNQIEETVRCSALIKAVSGGHVEVVSPEFPCDAAGDSGGTAGRRQRKRRNRGGKCCGVGYHLLSSGLQNHSLG